MWIKWLNKLFQTHPYYRSEGFAYTGHDLLKISTKERSRFDQLSKKNELSGSEAREYKKLMKKLKSKTKTN